MRVVRAVLIGGGALIIGIGAIVLAHDIAPRQYPAVLAWLLGALIVHDVVLSGLVASVAVAGRRARARIPLAPILLVQGALAVAAVLALIVVPEIMKKAAGTANPSILPLAYGQNLLWMYGALAVAAAVGIALHALLARRGAQSDAPPVTSRRRTPSAR